MQDFLFFAGHSGMAIFGAVGAFFAVAKIVDDVFGQKPIGQGAANYFLNFDPKPTFARAYVKASLLSEHLFGDRLFSLRALVVSAAISCLWISLMVIAEIGLHGQGSWVFNSVFSGVVLRQFWYFMLVGISIDFVSTVVARGLLLYAVDRRSTVKVAMLLLDILLSATLFFVLYTCAKAVILGRPIMVNPFDSFANWLGYAFNLQLGLTPLSDATLRPIGPHEMSVENGNLMVSYAFPEGMLFLSSLLPAFWILIHIAGYWTYGAAQAFTHAFQRLFKQAATESKPFTSFGLIICMIVALPLWLTILGGYLIFRSLH